jgi:hypothetical protein
VSLAVHKFMFIFTFLMCFIDIVQLILFGAFVARLMQGWLFYAEGSFWHDPQVDALVNSVPKVRHACRLGKLRCKLVFARLAQVQNPWLLG